MIPIIAVMLWAYVTAQIIEAVNRKGDRKPPELVSAIMVIMLVIVTACCIGLNLPAIKHLLIDGFKTLPGQTP